MPFDLELTPVYPGLTAVYALGGCVGVVVPRIGGKGFAFFHYEAAMLTFGEDEMDAVEMFYRARGNGDA